MLAACEDPTGEPKTDEYERLIPPARPGYWVSLNGSREQGQERRGTRLCYSQGYETPRQWRCVSRGAPTTRHALRSSDRPGQDALSAIRRSARALIRAGSSAPG